MVKILDRRDFADDAAFNVAANKMRVAMLRAVADSLEANENNPLTQQADDAGAALSGTGYGKGALMMAYESIDGDGDECFGRILLNIKGPGQMVDMVCLASVS